MSEKIFWRDPYQTQLDTRLSRVEGDQVWLEQTIFYAQSGGQESDSGTIAGRSVLLVEKQGLDIAYTLDSAAGLAAGNSVRVVIDWPRRYALMRLHFAAELVLELACRLRPDMEKIGAHIAAEKARIDFLHHESLAPLLPQLEAEVARIVAAQQPIVSAFSDEKLQRRYWQIDGLAQVPCGGTHLHHSGEVGALRLKRKNVGKGKERIEIMFAQD